MNKRTAFLLILSVICVITLAACSGGKTRVESDLDIEDAPDWVNESGQVVDDQGGRLFHGIGSAPDLGDLSLQRTTADQRARADLARILGSYMKVLSEDYVSSAGSENRHTEQAYSRDINSVTEKLLIGAKVIARWKNQENGDIWSLTELDLEQLKRTLGASKDLDDAMKQFMMEHTVTTFDKIKVK